MRRKQLFYLLLFLVAFLDSISALFDSYLVNDLGGDPFGYVNAFFISGLFVCVFMVITFSVIKPFGSFIDPAFRGFRLPVKKEFGYHVVAALTNSVSTVALMALFVFYPDPSTVLPFVQVSILFLLIIESFVEKNTPTLAEISASVTVTIGAIMASMSGGGIDLGAMALVFLVFCPSYAVYTIYQRKLKSFTVDGAPTDAINIRVWNMIFTAIFTSVIVFVYSTEVFVDSFSFLADNFVVITSVAIVSTAAYTLFIRALGLSHASVAQAVRSSTLIFSLAISFALGILFFPDLSFALLKFMGIILIIIGIVSLAFTEVRAFLLLNLKHGYTPSQVMGEMWDINGVDSVSVTAGEYDLIAVVRTRTLGKSYENIVAKLEGVEGIEDYTYCPVLREWEDI